MDPTKFKPLLNAQTKLTELDDAHETKTLMIESHQKAIQELAGEQHKVKLDIAKLQEQSRKLDSQQAQLQKQDGQLRKKLVDIEEERIEWRQAWELMAGQGDVLLTHGRRGASLDNGEHISGNDEVRSSSIHPWSCHRHHLAHQ